MEVEMAKVGTEYVLKNILTTMGVCGAIWIGFE